MKTLIRLIKGLDAVELQFIKDFYKTKSHQNSKRSRLFNLINTGKIKSTEDAHRLIYPERNNASSALSHLQKSLLDETLNLLIVIAPKQDTSKEEYRELDCKKKLLQSELLITRGFIEEGFTMLDKTRKLAEKYEFPDINLSSHNILLKYQNKLKQEKFKYFFERDITNYQHLIKAKRSYFFGKEKPDISLNNTGKCSLKRTYYWQELTRLDEELGHCNFKGAKDRLDALTHFMDKELPFLSDDKKGHLNKLNAEISLHLGEYSQAVDHAQKAMQFTRKHTHEFYDVRIILFVSLMRTGRLGDAEELYNKCLKDQCSDSFQLYKWQLFKGALDFKQKKYKCVCNFLQKREVKYEDNANWSLSPRLLELLAILEVGDYEWYEYRFDCLRKKYAKVRTKVSDRLQLIIALLQSLIKADFNYNTLLETEYEHFSKLQHTCPTYHWNPVGHEVINIPFWLQTKSTKFNLQAAHSSH